MVINTVMCNRLVLKALKNNITINNGMVLTLQDFCLFYKKSNAKQWISKCPPENGKKKMLICFVLLARKITCICLEKLTNNKKTGCVKREGNRFTMSTFLVLS